MSVVKTIIISIQPLSLRVVHICIILYVMKIFKGCNVNDLKNIEVF